MEAERRILFGPISGLLFLSGMAFLPFLVPGYDPVRQTVSEIGEAGSPAQWPFSLMLWSVAACTVVFAWALWGFARAAGRSTAAAWLTLCMAVCAAGIGAFAFPSPLHNLFGLSELIGYQAPLALALTWRGDPRLARVARFSGLMALLLWLAIGANLITLFRHSELFTWVRPVYGLVQRGLFVAWCAWCVGVGFLLARPGQGLSKV